MSLPDIGRIDQDPCTRAHIPSNTRFAGRRDLATPLSFLNAVDEARKTAIHQYADRHRPRIETRDAALAPMENVRISLLDLYNHFE